MFFRSVSNFFFEKQTPQIISPFIFFRRVLNSFFEKKLYREFSPFRMEKSPFWMEISPFTCFSEVFCFFKTSLQRFFSIQVFFLRGDLSIFLKHISTYNFIHPEWRFEDFSIHFFQKRFLLKNKLHK